MTYNKEYDTMFQKTLESQSTALRDRLHEVYLKQSEIATQAKRQESIVKGLELEVQQIVKNKADLEKAWNTLRSLLDRFSAQNIGKLAELLNKGVKSIFTDRDYEVKIDLSDTKRKQMKILLYEHKSDGESIENNLCDTAALLLSGGGVLVVVSFILQIYLILHYNKRRFILVDEGWTNISTSYLENFFQFLSYLTDNMGFTFLCINHDPRFEQFFHKVYRVNMGNLTLIKGNGKNGT